MKMEEFNRTISNVKMYESPNLHLEVTAKCCASCVFCGYRYIKRKKGEMSRELISKILDELAGWKKPMKEIQRKHKEGLRDEIELCKSCTFGGAFVGEANDGTKI